MTRYIDRQQLHKQVWKEPLTKLALKYRLKPYELKKLCDRFSIPLPKVGHWSKAAYGKAVQASPLPQCNQSKLKVRKEQQKEKQIQLPVKSVTPEIKIVVKKTLSNLHPLIERTRTVLKSIRIDDYEMKRTTRNAIDFRASKATENRALRIMDSLFKWFEKHGLEIITPYDNGVRTYVVIGEERIEIAIEEKSKYIGMVDRMSWGYMRHMRGYEPTGKLYLMIRSYCWGCGLRKTWSDGTTGQLEEKLHEFIEGVYAIAAYEKERTQKRKVEDEKREKVRKEKEYIQQCKELEKKMLSNLRTQAKHFKKSRQISEYIAEVEQKAKEKYGDSPYPKELLDWFSWARKHAKQFHPLNSGLPSYKSAIEVLKIEDIKSF